MLNLANTRQFQSGAFNVAKDVIGLGEGVALVAEYLNGECFVRPSTGKKGEQFIGVSLHNVTHDSVLSHTEVLPVKNGIVTLSMTPIDGSLTGYETNGSFVDNSSFAPYTGVTEDISSDTTITVSTSSTSFEVALVDANATSIVVTYKYSPTVQQVRSLVGDQYPGILQVSALGQTGVIVSGQVFTSYFDTTCDWSEPNAVYLAEGGEFTTNETGTLLSNVFVIQSPSVGSGFLGLLIK